MVTPALVGISRFYVLTEPQEYFFLSSLLSIHQEVAIGLYELPVFSVFVLIPAIPVIYLGLFLFLDDLVLFRDSLVRSKVVVVLRVGKQISGHCFN